MGSTDSVNECSSRFRLVASAFTFASSARLPSRAQESRSTRSDDTSCTARSRERRGAGGLVAAWAVRSSADCSALSQMHRCALADAWGTSGRREGKRTEPRAFMCWWPTLIGAIAGSLCAYPLATLSLSTQLQPSDSPSRRLSPPIRHSVVIAKWRHSRYYIRSSASRVDSLEFSKNRNTIAPLARRSAPDNCLLCVSTIVCTNEHTFYSHIHYVLTFCSHRRMLFCTVHSVTFNSYIFGIETWEPFTCKHYTFS